MKVYRGYNNEVGPISYDDWIYVTPDIEQAKWYATKNGDVKDGAIIEYDMYDDLTFLSLHDVNVGMEDYDEAYPYTYTIDDLLWHQEDISEHLYNYGAGIVFEDPVCKGHMIYILFDEKYLKNGRVISKEEFDAIDLKESVYDKKIGEILEAAGIQLTESILDAKAVGDELMNIILKNPTRRELRDNDMNICRGAMGRSGNFYFISLSQLAHCDLFDTLEQIGINDAPYNTFKYSNKTNTFYYYDPDNDLDFNLIKKELSKSPYFKNFAGCHFDTFTDPDYDPDLYESVQLSEREDLTKFNRIAGFYHYDTKQFELFPRTSEDISVEDDEVNDYIHNVHSKDEFTEFNIVRFGIEDIPGEGVVCYIEGDTKRNVEKCYYAILEKYAEECDIIKYELEYYVGNTHKYIYLDKRGNQIMESVNKGIDFVAYHGSHQPDMIPAKDRALYLTDDKELAEQFAKGEVYGDGLYDGEVATVFTFKGHFNKPYYMTHEEYDNEGQDDELDYQKWVNMGVDGIVLLPDEESSATYYIVIDLSTIKLIDKKVFEDKVILDEELIYADKDEDGYLTNEIFKNPSKEEIKKYNLSQTRVVIDGEGNFYFCLAGALIHDDIIDKIGKGDNYSLFYDYYKNTFYKRDEYRNEEEHKKMNKRLREWLLSYPYIKNNFGTDFNVYVFSYEYGEEPFDIKIEKLDESVNLKKLNRLAGFYHYNSGNWEMLPRTERHLDSIDDYEEYCKYCHDYTVEDLFEEDMIRFHIEDINNFVSCAIESPYQHWIKPFIRKLYTKFPEEMAMVKKFEIEYYKEDGTRKYQTVEV